MRTIIVFILLAVPVIFFVTYAAEYLDWVAEVEKQRLDSALAPEYRKAVIDRVLDH